MKAVGWHGQRGAKCPVAIRASQRPLQKKRSKKFYGIFTEVKRSDIELESPEEISKALQRDIAETIT
jgi:hypothetical protein